MSHFTVSHSDPNMDVSSGGRVRFSPQGWRDYKARCKRLGLTVTDDNKDWTEKLWSAATRFGVQLGVAGILAAVALLWQISNMLAVIESNQNAVMQGVDSLETRMVRRERQADVIEERVKALERTHERTPH